MCYTAERSRDVLKNAFILEHGRTIKPGFNFRLLQNLLSANTLIKRSFYVKVSMTD